MKINIVLGKNQLQLLCLILQSVYCLNKLPRDITLEIIRLKKKIHAITPQRFNNIELTTTETVYLIFYLGYVIDREDLYESCFPKEKGLILISKLLEKITKKI